MGDEPCVKRLTGGVRGGNLTTQTLPQSCAELGFQECLIGICHLPRKVLLPFLVVMRVFLQAVAMIYISACARVAADPAKTFAWTPLKVQQSIFKNDLGMLDTEREDYATNLASIAANYVAKAKASAESLVDARRLIGLALQLSPRNKRAVVLNFQFGKGILPEATEMTYSPQVFARLILTRGKLLEKQGGAENEMLARYFIQLAPELDPKNEDAVYSSEVQRLDRGAADWSAITEPDAKKE